MSRPRDLYVTTLAGRVFRFLDLPRGEVPKSWIYEGSAPGLAWAPARGDWPGADKKRESKATGKRKGES